MAGNQVLDWSSLSTDLKTLKLNNESQYPPDLLISGNFRVNWRTAWSYKNKTVPIAYQSGRAQRVAYTNETYNTPQKLWTKVAQEYL
jgi:hypothetical protein